MSLKFHLSKDFVSKFVGKQPNWGPLGYITYKRTYARPVPGENRTEEFWETLVRVVEGVYSIQRQHCANLRLEWNQLKAQKSAQTMFQLMWDFKFLPPGRGLQMMGTKLVEKQGNAALQNCAFVSTQDLAVDFAAPFCFMMDMSMLGVGVGGDTKGANSITIQKPRQSFSEFHVIPDTREGWVDVVRRWLESYAGKGCKPAGVDFTQIRPYGTPIAGFGGTASGPAPLQELLQHIDEILEPRIGQKITSTDIVDLFNAVGRCVVSGNVRRSAQIMFGNLDDANFLELKDPDINAEKLGKWRWTSNNSVFAQPGDDYSDIIRTVVKNGEPGILWLETAKAYGRLADPCNWTDIRAEGTNPCGEITLESFEFCTLVETFPANHDSMEDWIRTLRFAYLYAKTVTLVPSHDARSNAVMLRNRRIGVSQSGIAQAIAKFGLNKVLTGSDTGYKKLKELDRKYSEWLCIPQSIKLTTVKPSGTVSLLPGATPGIHFPQSEYYWRTIRFDTGSPLVSLLRESGYRTIPDKNLPATTIVYFPVKEQNFNRSVAEVSIWEQAELAALMQHWWADNQVSVTINFQPNEQKEIGRVLAMFDRRLKSVSFLPYTDHQYEHAPYQPITKAEYLEAIKTIRPLGEVLEMESQMPVLYCDSDRCEIR